MVARYSETATLPEAYQFLAAIQQLQKG